MPVTAALPPRTHLLIRGATILSMDPAVGELVGDVEVRDGRIEAVGQGLVAEGARIIDASRSILIPGFVDTHWHIWGTLLRGVIGDGHKDGWFARKERLAPYFSPEDTAAGVRLGLADGLAGGVTTVHDWAHNVLSAEDADANLAALGELGVRARWSYGAPSTTPGLSLDQMASVMARVGKGVDEPMDFDHIERVSTAVAAGRDGLIHVGVALRGPSRSTIEVVREEWRRSRALGLPIAMHCAGTKAEVGKIRQVQVLEGEGLLGPDMLLAHGNYLDATDIALVARNEIPVSVSPLAELRLAMGLPQITEFLEAGIRVSFSVDTSAIAGAADPFQAMRLAAGLEAVRFGDPQRLPPRRVLQLATIDGARSLGLGEVTGSITPGKRADLVLLTMDTLAASPVVDPAVAVVHSGSPAAVSTVIVDGRVLKDHGRLVHVDADAVVGDARDRLADLCRRADFEPTFGRPPAGPTAH